MALGKKSKPEGYFELGDLLYVKKTAQDQVLTYAQPDPTSGSFKILDPDGFIGVINDEDSSTSASGTWLGVKTGSNTMVYIELNSSLLYSKANPEYNYPDAAATESGKSGGFNWSGLLEGITAVSSLILSKITNKNTNGGIDNNNGVGNSVDTSQTRSPIMAWIMNNILLVLLLPLVIILIVILVWKPKKKAQAQYQANVPPPLNATKL
jgi:hypothetical protein